MQKLDLDTLLDAIEQCSSRGLYQTSKWLSELLGSAAYAEDDDMDEIAEANMGSTSTNHSKQTAGGRQYTIAKSFFDCQEYSRCAAILEGSPSTDAKSVFLKLYARYLSGEKNQEEDGETVLGPGDGKISNAELVPTLAEIEQCLDTKDSYLYFLYGLLRRKLDEIPAAIQALIRAIVIDSSNWAAWHELSLCMPDAPTINKCLSQLPDHPFALFFNISSLLDLHLSGDEIANQLSQLESFFPRCAHLMTMRAVLAYNAQDFEAAEEIFDELHRQDPHRMDSIDVYSNVLFVLERRAKLSHLAKTISAIDKFRPETCCVIGNYYSLMSDHESAVTYFRRALKLDRSYLAAWTLMGHEYVELKNTHAAIESYRRAVDINRKDYRAWYGLGQAYEMLEMHYYALHYFQRAASLKPLDVRMWSALGNCYEKLGRVGEAVKAYRRALLGDGALDVAHLLKLGELYHTLGDLAAARRQFETCVQVGRNNGSGGIGVDPSVDITVAENWLARFANDRDGR